MILGGYCVEVPPLPIPNRVVKLNYADGTAVTCGRVGNRHFDAPRKILGRFFVWCGIEDLNERYIFLVIFMFF